MHQFCGKAKKGGKKQTHAFKLGIDLSLKRDLLERVEQAPEPSKRQASIEDLASSVEAAD